MIEGGWASLGYYLFANTNRTTTYFCRIWTLNLKHIASYILHQGIRIWNYNANMELSYIGAKHARISLDGTALHYRPLLLRRAPGDTCYDYVQQIDLLTIDDRWDNIY